MYEAFFGLKEKPFSLTPNPKFLYLSKTHNEVYAHLLYGVEHRAGFIMVAGEVGTGKTTILRTLLNNLDESVYRLAFIFNPKLTATELLHNINREFGIDDPAQSLPGLIDSLNRFLLEENLAGRVPVLVIDEAQNLSGDVLEQIRLLSNLETETDKLLQIVLVGQPELPQQLQDPSLRQLNQRIAIRYRLVHLNRQETCAYIMHRLKVAGRPDGSLFTAAAIQRVYRASRGVPRMINLLCDRALLSAYSSGQGTVTPRHVREAVLELAGEHEKLERPGVLWGWLGGVLGLALLLAVLLAITVYRPSGPVVSKIAAEASVKPSQVIPLTLVSVAPPDRVTACNTLLTAWHSPVVHPQEDEATFNPETVFALRGLQVMKLRGTFSQLLTFNLPFVFMQSDAGQIAYYALSKPESNGWLVTPALHGKSVLTASELEQLGELAVYMPWKDFADIGYVAAPGARGPGVKNLQLLLGMTGYFDASITGRYDRATTRAVQRFQKDHGLIVDGMVGPRTLVLLYRAARAYAIPALLGGEGGPV